MTEVRLEEGQVERGVCGNTQSYTAGAEATLARNLPIPTIFYSRF